MKSTVLAFALAVLFLALALAQDSITGSTADYEMAEVPVLGISGHYVPVSTDMVLTDIKACTRRGLPASSIIP